MRSVVTVAFAVGVLSMASACGDHRGSFPTVPISSGSATIGSSGGPSSTRRTAAESPATTGRRSRSRSARSVETAPFTSRRRPAPTSRSRLRSRTWVTVRGQLDHGFLLRPVRAPRDVRHPLRARVDPRRQDAPGHDRRPEAGVLEQDRLPDPDGGRRVATPRPGRVSLPRRFPGAGESVAHRQRLKVPTNATAAPPMREATRSPNRTAWNVSFWNIWSGGPQSS
jgi:hypothetical protein